MPAPVPGLRADAVSPAAGRSGPWLVAAERRTFAGSAEFLADPANRADFETYLADLTRPYPPAGSSPAGPAGEDASAGSDDPVGSAGPAGGHSYGEMAEALIGAVVPDGRPVDLLVLAYAIHDVQPGRATATYLSSVCPGTPLSFAISDQGTAAAFSALRIVQDYLASPSTGRGRRALLIVVEQAGLPYPSPAARPAEHRGVAMLFDSTSGGVPAGATGRLVSLRQRPNLAAGAVAGQAAADLAELSTGYRRVRVVANPALAGSWTGGPEELRVTPAGQPSTGVWWQLLDELAEPPDLVLAGDYDPELGYLCWAGFEAGS